MIFCRASVAPAKIGLVRCPLIIPLWCDIIVYQILEYFSVHLIICRDNLSIAITISAVCNMQAFVLCPYANAFIWILVFMRLRFSFPFFYYLFIYLFCILVFNAFAFKHFCSLKMRLRSSKIYFFVLQHKSTTI